MRIFLIASIVILILSSIVLLFRYVDGNQQKGLYYISVSSECDLNLKTNEFWLYNQCSIQRNIINGKYVAVFHHIGQFGHRLGLTKNGYISYESEFIPASEFDDTCKVKGFIRMFIEQEIRINNQDPRYDI